MVKQLVFCRDFALANFAKRLYLCNRHNNENYGRENNEDVRHACR